MCTVLLSPGGYPIAVNKYIISYIISYHIIYHIISCHIIYHIISYHIISYHMSYHIIYHIISYHISYHIISNHIISYIISSYPDVKTTSMMKYPEQQTKCNETQLLMCRKTIKFYLPDVLQIIHCACNDS
jgi:hypothetical protein